MNNNPLLPSPTPNYQTRDRLNSWTHPLPCRFLEWSGWYNQTIHNRLIGHYRLYTHFQKAYAKSPNPDFPATSAYILHYRANYGPRHFLAKAISLLFSTIALQGPTPASQYAILNHHLLHTRPDILQQFLIAAGANLATALHHAHQAILDPDFFTHQTSINQNHLAIQYNSRVIFQPLLREGAKGKAKGVFSKKQLLIFFDLLSETNAIERIDFRKPNKFREIAALLHSISGKSTDSLIEELNLHRDKSLYRHHTTGERDQLIITLTNLAETFRAAGFRSIAKQADSRIRDLERSVNA